MPLPLAKLIAVAVRQAAKPAASYMQKRAETNETFRRICIRFATFYHALEYRLIQSFYERKASKFGHVPTLNEQRAIELGTTLFGEIFLFTVAAIALAAEYQRGQFKEQAKERSLQEQLELLQSQVAYLMARTGAGDDVNPPTVAPSNPPIQNISKKAKMSSFQSCSFTASL